MKQNPLRILFHLIFCQPEPQLYRKTGIDRPDPLPVLPYLFAFLLAVEYIIA